MKIPFGSRKSGVYLCLDTGITYSIFVVSKRASTPLEDKKVARVSSKPLLYPAAFALARVPNLRGRNINSPCNRLVCFYQILNFIFTAS